jgi:hypothetical protein
MKNRAFTLLELLMVVFAIVLTSIVILSIAISKSNNDAKSSFSIGDTVTLEISNDCVITGRVSQAVYKQANIMIMGTNGIPTVLNNIPTSFLKKVIVQQPGK